MGDSVDHQSILQMRRFLYLGDETKAFPHSIHFPFNLEKLQFLQDIKQSMMEQEAIREIIRFYKQGHFLDYETVIFCLVNFAHSNYPLVKHNAFKAAPEICSSADLLLTFTHLYKKVVDPSKGWGRAHRTFLSSWYNARDAKALAADVTKIKSRHKWTHKDVLCMAHVKGNNPGNAAVLKYLVRGIDVAEKEFGTESEAESIIKYLKGAQELRTTKDQNTAARLIELHDLCLEHIPSKILCSREVSLCAITRLKLKDLLKQLPRFNRVGLLRPNNNHSKALLERLSSSETLQDDSVDPLETFLALRKWQISNKITPGKTPARQSNPALDDAIHRVHLESFKSLKSSGKRFLVALNIDVTMNLNKCAECTALTPSHVSDVCLMALVRAELESVATVVFSTNEVVSVDINGNMSLGEVIENLSQVPFGPVVLSGPINWALTKKMPLDAFIVFTDKLSSAEYSDLASVFNEYKETMHLPNTKFILCTLCDHTSTFPHGYPSYLHIVGFNPKLLKVLHDFTCSVF